LRLHGINSLLGTETVVAKTLSSLLFIFLLINIQPITAHQFNDEVLPIDPALQRYQLANGLDVAVYPNAYPEKIIELRLVVKTGSINELDNQHGLAHFVEHMAFNGTKHFPDNSMIRLLEERGVKFGQHNNASTSFNETIYKISILNEKDNLDFALRILRDIAGNMTISEQAFEQEKGVVLEEVRLRTLGQNARIQKQQLSYFHPNSPFLKHPVGTKESVSSLTYQQARDFYNKWYKANNMRLVIVGDYGDKEKLNADIKLYFSPIDSDSALKQRIHQYYPSQASSILYTDKEPLPERVSLSTPLKNENQLLINGVYNSWYYDFIARLLNERFERVVENNPSTFKSAGLYKQIRYDDSPHLLLTASLFNETAANGLELLQKTYFQATKHGFTSDEINAALQKAYNSLDSYIKNQHRQPSSGFANRLMGLLDRKGNFMSVEQFSNIRRQFLSTLSAEKIQEELKTYPETNFSLAYMSATDAPIKPLLEQLQTFNKSKVSRWKAEPSISALFEKPIPRVNGFNIEKNEEYGVEIVHLENGVTVYFKHHDASPGKISLKALRHGGTLHLDKKNYISAGRMLPVKWASKSNGVSASSIKRYLRDNNIFLGQTTRSRNTEIGASAKVENIDKMMNAIDWLFNDVNFDEKTLVARKKAIKEAILKDKNNPRSQFYQKLNQLKYKDHWSKKTLTEKQIDEMSTEQLRTLYRKFFQNASGYQFFFTGDLNSLGESKTTILSALSRLPSTEYKAQKPKDYAKHVQGQHNFVSATNNENKAQLSIHFYSEQYEATSYRDWELNRLIKDWLNTKLTEKIREEMSATYHVGISADDNSLDTHYLTNTISTTTSPDLVEKVKEIIVEEIASLQQTLIATEALEALKAKRLRSHFTYIQKEKYWQDTLIDHFFWHYSTNDMLKREQLISGFTAQDMKKGINNWFNSEHSIISILKPNKS